jgi:phage major head subunit gpT-like protein
MGAIGLSSRAIIGAFYARLALNSGAEWVDPVSMLFQSDQGSEEYKWLGMAPVMREWLAGRTAKGFRENGIEIKNLEFEATLEVLVKELRRDKTGQILIRVKEMADRTNDHWASLLSTLIINAESKVCYDGQYFFDTDHSEGDSGTQSNDLSVDISALPCNQHGSTTAPSPEELELTILQCVQAILGFKDDQGEPLNGGANSFIAMLPVPFMAAGMAAITNPVLTSGKTNSIIASPFKIIPVVNPRLTWTTELAVFRTDGNVKPFIRQEEQPVQIDAIAEGSELEFNENKHRYGVKASRNVGYGYWQHGCLATLA